MPFIPVDETVRVALTFQDNAGNEAVNVIHFRREDSPVTLPDMAALEVILIDWLENYWSPRAATTWHCRSIDMLDLTIEDGLYRSTSVDIQGTDTDSPLPSMMTIAISLRSNFAGRSRRGRLYHVGLSEGRIAGDYLTDLAAVSLIQCYEALLDGLDTSGWVWCVVSYVSDGVPRTQGLRTDITNIVLTDLEIDRQIRRRPA